MTPLEQYIQDFLKPAHPTRWSMEPTRAIRRDMTSWYQWMDKEGKTQYRQFRRNALDHQIEMGYREILNWRDETVASSCCPSHFEQPGRQKTPEKSAKCWPCKKPGALDSRT